MYPIPCIFRLTENIRLRLLCWRRAVTLGKCRIHASDLHFIDSDYSENILLILLCWWRAVTLGKYRIHGSDLHFIDSEYPYTNHHSLSQVANLFLLGLPVERYQ